MDSELSQIDRTLINRLQDDLPVTTYPFAELSKELNVSEQDVIDRLKSLLKNGTLTRFGPFFDAQAIGGAFCLCAMEVPESKFEEVSAKVNSYPEVAHNYERDHQLNMWFVMATESLSDIETTAKAIEKDTGLRVYLFPKEYEYYVRFRVEA